jgi:TIGR03009 family protein
MRRPTTFVPPVILSFGLGLGLTLGVVSPETQTAFGQASRNQTAPAGAQAAPSSNRTARAAQPPVAAGQPARPAPSIANADPKMLDLLNKWEKQSQRLKTLSVKIYRVDRTVAFGTDHFEGIAKFQSPDLAFIQFNKVKLDNDDKPVLDKQNKRILSNDETIICTGQEVWQYKFESQQVFIYPLAPEERERAVEEGPLPFLFNMKAEQARQRYEMKLADEDEKSYTIQVKPRLEIDQQSFGTSLVRLDKTFLLPTRIVLISPDRKHTTDFVLSDIQANQPVDSKFFKGVEPKAPWKVVRNPAGEGTGQAPGAVGASQPQEAPGRRPFQRLRQSAQRPAAPNQTAPR